MAASPPKIWFSAKPASSGTDAAAFGKIKALLFGGGPFYLTPPLPGLNSPPLAEAVGGV